MRESDIMEIAEENRDLSERQQAVDHRIRQLCVDTNPQYPLGIGRGSDYAARRNAGGTRPPTGPRESPAPSRLNAAPHDWHRGGTLLVVLTVATLAATVLVLCRRAWSGVFNSSTNVRALAPAREGKEIES